jgi:hypothetical protein
MRSAGYLTSHRPRGDKVELFYGRPMASLRLALIWRFKAAS